MKKLLLVAAILISHYARSQTFTIIDSLPKGAYGAAAWGDYDGDGFKDLIYIAQQATVDGTDMCRVYHNTNNTFTEVASFSKLFNPAVQWADLDNDGLDDIIMSGFGVDSATMQFYNRTLLYKSNGNGTFTAMPNAIAGLNSGAIDIADYNNDGFKDIAMAGMDSLGIAHAYIYKGTAGFGFVPVSAPLVGVYRGEVKWGDYNNDGLKDLVVTGLQNDNSIYVRVYKNMGNDSFQLQPEMFPGTAGTVDWVDNDNDGNLDIFITGYDSSDINITDLLHNNGDGTFTNTTINIPGFGEPSAVAIADFDNDGHKDICILGGSSFSFYNSALVHGTGTANYVLDTFYTGDVQNAICETADIDGDGDYDLIFSNLVLRNDAPLAVKNEQAAPIDVSLYPNPASDNVTIRNGSYIVSVTVYDAAGRAIVFTGINALSYTLPLRGLPAGSYPVAIRLEGNKVTIKKLIVQ